MSEITSRVDKIVVRGARLKKTFRDALLTGGAITLGVDEPASLTMSFLDPELDLLESTLLTTGAPVDYGSLKWSAAVMRTPEFDGVPSLAVTCRLLGVRKLRQARGAKVWRGSSPSQVARQAAAAAGLRAVVQPSASRKQIKRGKKQSTYGLLADLGTEIGFWFFVSGNRLFFGKPTWLLKNAPVTRKVRWYRRSGHGDELLVGFPQCRRSEDSKKGPAEITVELLGDGVDEWRPGDAMVLVGVPTFEGKYLVTSVTIPLDEDSPVSVTAVTPENPKPQPAADRTDGDKDDEARGGPAASGTVEKFVQTALGQVGDAYVFGAEASKSDPDPDTFDCSELVEWALARVGVAFVDGSANQEAFCRAKGTIVSVERAITTRGALLFAPGHVAISLGDGRTVEAVNRTYGVTTMNARGRSSVSWRAGGLVPGLKYGK